ncbi:hypothetical protein LTS18_014332, partial [Coniosporium uncinatum]
MNPAERAAAILKARAEFNEKQAEKERRAEKDRLKRLDRETQKKSQDEERQKRKSESDQRRQRTRTISNEKVPEITGAREYAKYNQTHARALPARVEPASPQRNVHAQSKSDGSSKSLKKQWLAFIAWLRTRFLRMGKKVH